MASATGRQLISSLCNWPSSTSTSTALRRSFIKQKSVANSNRKTSNITVAVSSAQYSRLRFIIPKATQGNANKDDDDDDDDDEDGVSLGTMKLPPNTDLATFGTLLFQWANSLCQGANLPLPLPLKVDKIAGGARLGFITISDGGEVQVLTYIDCIVIPAAPTDDGSDSEVPIFRAIRKGVLKDKSPPGEPRIMRSLQGALFKSVQIAS